jgi:hypothetical protein
MVGNVKLVDSIFTSNRDWKLEIHFEKGCLHPQVFDFIRKLTVQHSLPLTKLHVGHFRFFIESFLVKLQNEMCRWSTWYCHTYHAWKLEIHFEKGCCLLRLVRFVSNAHAKHSSYCNVLNNMHFRFVIVYFWAKLWSEMVSWWSRISWTNHDRKLEIQVENWCFLLHLLRFVWNAPDKHSLR